MNAKEFFDAVVRLRELQKLYFKTRSGQALLASKAQEKLIDNEIERVNRVIDKKHQLDLFDK